MQLFQIQGFFAPFIATIMGIALLLLWNYHRSLRYLPFFGFALFAFALGFIFSQVAFDKMTFPSAIASSTMYHLVGGLMVHGALVRLGDKLNSLLYILMMLVDLSGRLLILQFDLSSDVYLIYANAVMGMPMALGAITIWKHDSRDLSSIFLSASYAAIAAMAIIAPTLVLQLGDTVTSENYFSSYYWVFLSILTVFGVCILIVSIGITVGQDLMKVAEQNASKDFLSGLLTRRAFDQKANELSAASMQLGKPIGIVMLDIDHFKKINDQFGHHTGDLVISAFGKMLTKAVSNNAIAGRTGGEEFCVVISGCDLGTVRLFAEGLRVAVSMLKIYGIPDDKQITSSFGVTLLRSTETLGSGFIRADEALYEAKDAGRNRVVASSINFTDVVGREQVAAA